MTTGCMIIRIYDTVVIRHTTYNFGLNWSNIKAEVVILA